LKAAQQPVIIARDDHRFCLEPAIMGMGPVPAVRKVMDRAGLKLEQINVFEVNEAFAAQALAVARELGSGIVYITRYPTAGTR
jgi:acetyl-CoA acetyltransferase